MVAGKGGVGRTTVAAALAERAARDGRRVLAVDALGTGDLDRLVASRPGAPRYETLRLTTGEALDQYIKIYLRLPVRPSWLGSPTRAGPLARIFEYVSAAAPGVREILVIGKIGWEVRTGHWDEVIVDGPATGHAVELLDAPRTMAELVPAGPLAAQTDWLRAILAAPTTGTVVVTTADELPVTETGELIDRIRAETETRVEQLIANRVPSPVSEAGRLEADRLGAAGSVLAPVARLAADRHLAAEAQLQRLDDRSGDGEVGPAVRVVEDWGDPVGSVIRALDHRADGSDAVDEVSR